MREIKYRAWDSMLEKMLAWGELKASGMSLFVILETQNLIKPMQYTGLKDKNGTEIYEGDILKRTVTIHVFGSDIPEDDVDEYLKVEYRNEYAGFFIGESPLHHYVGARHDVHTKCRCTDVEVIGNIYENKELLA